MKLAYTPGLLSLLLIGCTDKQSIPTSVQPVSWQAASTTKATGRSTSNEGVSADVFVAVNQYRVSLGKSRLVRHEGLELLAKQHCEFLIKNQGKFSVHGSRVSHEGFEERVFTATKIYRMESMAENVAAAPPSGSDSATALLRLWKGSKGHHDTLLQDWTYTGVAAVRGDDGYVYSTQLFANQQIGLNSLNARLTQRF